MSVLNDIENMTKMELMKLMVNSELSPAEMMIANKALRGVLRDEEAAIREQEREAKQDSIRQQKELKTTLDALMSSRKDMTMAFAEMNKLVNNVSLLKNLKTFENKATVYITKQISFTIAVTAHIEKLKSIAPEE